MATRQVEPQPGYLKLGDEFESGYMALANKREITESGRLFLAALGDQLESGTRVNRTRMRSSQENKEGHRLSFALQRIVNVVDTVLEWLEHSGKNAVMSLKKQEMALRGVFHLTDLGNQANVFAILEFGSSFLDVKEDPFRVQRDFIIECLRDIDEQKERILQLVDEACEILKAIIDTETVDILKGMHFDNVVRQARVQIKSCRRRLDTAEQKICELSTKMTTIKWFSRTFRFTVWGLSCYYFYQKYKQSTVGLPLFFISSTVAGAVLLSLYPSRAYEFHESLSKLSSTHYLLTERLEDLRERLASAKDYKDGFIKDMDNAV